MKGLKCKASDAGHSDVPERSHEVLVLSEKVSLNSIRILSSHVITRREVSTIRYFERAYIHINFITVYCCKCYSFLLVIVINLLLCLIYKVNCFISMYV